MATSLNKVTLIGNVGNDPEIRSTNDGKEIANLSIATSQSWKDRVTGEKREKTEWHRVVVFNDILVRIIKDYVKKGSKIFIEGELQTRKWQDQSGADKYTTEVVLQNYNANLILLDRKSGPDNNSLDNGSSGGYNSSANYNSNNANLDDEVPF